mmetsp:Transcript_9662/g.20286  ORF Transcript_9662/g.20286 Transcript_9662/m.20286 type:complete len:107 (+) Transcript_9662:372-692(+)
MKRELATNDENISDAKVSHSFDLLPERTTLRKPCLATRWLAQDRRAATANDDALSMAEHSCDVETARAFHIHEERVRCLYQALELVSAQLKLTRWVKKVNIAHGDE